MIRRTMKIIKIVMLAVMLLFVPVYAFFGTRLHAHKPY